jgi:hypothetical protein
LKGALKKLPWHMGDMIVRQLEKLGGHVDEIKEACAPKFDPANGGFKNPSNYLRCAGEALVVLPLKGLGRLIAKYQGEKMTAKQMKMFESASHVGKAVRREGAYKAAELKYGSPICFQGKNGAEYSIDLNESAFRWMGDDAHLKFIHLEQLWKDPQFLDKIRNIESVKEFVEQLKNHHNKLFPKQEWRTKENCNNPLKLWVNWNLEDIQKAAEFDPEADPTSELKKIQAPKYTERPWNKLELPKFLP